MDKSAFIKHLVDEIVAGRMDPERAAQLLAVTERPPLDVTLPMRVALTSLGYEDLGHSMCMWGIVLTEVDGGPAIAMVAGGPSDEVPDVSEEEMDAIGQAIVMVARAKNIDAVMDETNVIRIHGPIYSTYHQHPAENVRVGNEEVVDIEAVLAEFDKEFNEHFGEPQPKQTPPPAQGWDKWGL